MWLSRVFHRYFVARDETKAHLEALGLPGGRITVSGIPIDSKFAEPIDIASVRQSYGLKPKLTTLLVSAGALGVGPTEMIVTRLKQLRHKTQSIVICGRNDALREKVEEIIGADDNFCVLGYSDRMAELMRTSDLFIGKPGGITTSEALVCGLPMVIVSPVPGQEERNSDHLLEEGVAIKCNNLVTLPYKVDQLLDHPTRLKRMRTLACKLGRPDSARVIVNTLLDDNLRPLHLSAKKREEIAQAASSEVAV